MSYSVRMFCVTACMALATTAQARDFRSADIHPTDYPTVEAVQLHGQATERADQGQARHQGVSRRGRSARKRTRSSNFKIGGLDMMRISAAPLNNIVPETIPPSRFRSCSARSITCARSLDGPIGDEILAAMESQGMIGLAFYDSGARSFYTTKKPVKTVADLKGDEDPGAAVRSVRCHDRGAGRERNSDALRRGLHGTQDRYRRRAPRTTGPLTNRRGISRRPSITTMTEHAMLPEVLVMSKQDLGHTFQGRPGGVRKAAKESVPYMRKLWDEREQKSRKMVEAGGAQVVAIPNKQEFVDAMKPVYAKFANTPKLQDLVKRIQDTK